MNRKRPPARLSRRHRSGNPRALAVTGDNVEGRNLPEYRGKIGVRLNVQRLVMYFLQRR